MGPKTCNGSSQTIASVHRSPFGVVLYSTIYANCDRWTMLNFARFNNSLLVLIESARARALRLLHAPDDGPDERVSLSGTIFVSLNDYDEFNDSHHFDLSWLCCWLWNRLRRRWRKSWFLRQKNISNVEQIAFAFLGWNQRVHRT